MTPPAKPDASTAAILEDGAAAPEGKGRWVRVWVPDGSKVSLRSAAKFRDYQREYMRKRRAKPKV